MKKRVSLIFLIFLLNNLNFCIDTVSTKYFPLAVGNSWTYYSYSYRYPYGQSWRYKITITGTVITNAHIYYIMKITSPGSSDTSKVRIDSLNGRILYFETPSCTWLNNEILADSLESRKFDSCRANCDTVYAKCTDTSMTTIFGFDRPSKVFNQDKFEDCNDRTYVRDFGLTYHYDCGGVGYGYSQLIGCVINGVLYGDTLIGIEPISKQIPVKYQLFQNFPNPFNPSTKIKFSIPNGVVGQTFLSVYDVLGREVATLVNEKLQPGSYEVEWNGSNYTSGVYFYRLVIGGKIINSKKMILLK